MAFVAGAFVPSRVWSAVGGMGALLAALAGYYVAAPFAGNASSLNGIAAFWLVAALLGIIGFALVDAVTATRL